MAAHLDDESFAGDAAHVAGFEQLAGGEHDTSASRVLAAVRAMQMHRLACMQQQRLLKQHFAVPETEEASANDGSADSIGGQWGGSTSWGCGPVTHAGVYPLYLLYSSKNQLITCTAAG